MAVEAVVRQDRLHIAIEFDLGRDWRLGGVEAECGKQKKTGWFGHKRSERNTRPQNAILTPELPQEHISCEKYPVR
jgi:hypothetical protein